MTWKRTVTVSALVTVIFIRDTSGPPMIGPIAHDSVEITPTSQSTDDSAFRCRQVQGQIEGHFRLTTYALVANIRL